MNVICDHSVFYCVLSSLCKRWLVCELLLWNETERIRHTQTSLDPDRLIDNRKTFGNWRKSIRQILLSHVVSQFHCHCLGMKNMPDILLIKQQTLPWQCHPNTQQTQSWNRQTTTIKPRMTMTANHRWTNRINEPTKREHKTNGLATITFTFLMKLL